MGDEGRTHDKAPFGQVVGAKRAIAHGTTGEPCHGRQEAHTLFDNPLQERQVAQLCEGGGLPI